MLEQPAQILVLEDDPELRETMAEVLEDEGYQVVAVARGEDAVARASLQNFDLIVSDIRMDGMDGLEAIDQTQRLQPAMGSLVVSGYCSEQETLRALGLNVGGYMRKPFALNEFLQSVRAILQRHEVQRRYQAQVDRYRQAWLYTQNQLVLVWDQQAFPGLQRWLDLCRRIAHQAGAPAELSERLAAVLAWQVTGQSPSAATGLQLNPAIQLEKQLLELGQFLWPYASSEWPEAEELPEGLRESYQKALHTPLAAPEEETGGSLLALAQTLEEAQPEAAGPAYEKLLRLPGETGLQACLGLARIAWRQRDAAGWQQRTQQLNSLLQPLPPYQGAKAVAELALLTRQPHLMAEARQRLQALPSSPELWVMELSDPQSSEEARNQSAVQLLSPRCQAQLAGHAPGLLPEIFARVSAARGGRRLTLLAMDYAPQLLLLLPQLSPAALQNLLQAFQSCPQELPKELLQGLLNHPEVSVRQRACELQETHETVRFLRLNSFGFFAAQCGPKKVAEGDWRTQKVKYMLAYLASRWDRPVGEEELLELFWPEARGTKRNLYVATSTLRKVLRPHPEAVETDYVVRQAGRLGLNLQLPIWHDASEAESAWLQAQEHQREGRAAQARDCLAQMCDLATGPFLEGCYMDWALRRRRQWEERLARASVQLAQSALQQQAWQEAVGWAERSLGWEPAQLEAHTVRLRAYLGLRQPDAVIRHFELAENALRREFELEPSTEMLEAYHRARHGIFS